LDWTVPGALLLELYTFDGVGSMVSRDRYEGTRAARPGDWAHIKSILEPLAREGVTVAVDDAALIDEVTRGVFHVVERDGKIIACAALRKYRDRDDAARSPGAEADGGPATSASSSARRVTAEVGSFAVRVGYRNEGRGDQLLSYLERTALRAGVTRLFLLTTRTADWFVERGFIFAGEAKGHPLLPAGKVVKEGRGSQLYIRALVDEAKEEAKEAKAKAKEEAEEAEAKEAEEAKEEKEAKEAKETAE
jgi:amino-acid N-acetyltransferase